MADEADREAAGTHYVLLSALLVAAVVSTAAFARVYQGSGTTLRLVLVAVGALGIAAALERRHILLAAAISASGLALAITWLVFPETSAFGLPTMATARAAVDALAVVGRASSSQVAPAPPIPPLLLGGVTAAWTAAFAAHSLAARGRSPFLAIVPAAALMAFAGIVMEDGSRPAYVFVFVAGALGVLFADGLRRVGGWGPVTLWHGRRKLRVGSGTTARRAWRVAFGCVLVATFVPWLLPGFGARGLLSLQGGPAQHVSINPIVDIRPRLLQHPVLQLMQVQSDQASYWRFVTDDSFTGRVWQASNSTATRGLTVARGTLTNSLPSLPCANPQSDATLLLQFPRTCPRGYPDEGPRIYPIHQRFTFGPLAQPWLPAAADPVSVGVEKGTVRFDPASGIIYAADGTYRGYSYDVSSVVVVPTPAELNLESNLVTSDTSQYVSLPSNMPPQIGQIARQWTAGAATPYEKIMAIQTHLLRFQYDQRVTFKQDSNDLVYFLTVARRGFCEQFAGAMAVLLRSIGIPARVAVGFTPGAPNPRSPGTWNVTTQNAHAWVEVPFPQYGWLQFEPTPGRSNPVAASYDAPPTIALGPLGSCIRFAPKTQVCLARSGAGPAPGQFSSRHGSSRYETKLTHELRNTLGARLPTPRIRPVPLTDRLRWWGLRIALLVLAAVALAIPTWKLVRRRAMLQRVSAPGDKVLAAYRALLADAADLGYGRRPWETVEEYRDRLTATVEFSNGDLDRLTTLAAEAAYGRDDVSAADATTAAASARTVTRDLRRAAPASRRMAGIYRIDRRDRVD